jgi:CHRD domain
MRASMFSKLQPGMPALVAILVGGVVVPGLSFSSALAQERTFTTFLAGHQEVPPTDSQATGTAQFDVTGEDSISYTVNATDIQAVTAGHIHCGELGENGPVVVTLFNYDSPQDDVSEGGTITEDNLEGPMAGSQLSDLIDALNNGQAYVNIHTEQNPDGEIRGHIVIAGRGAG